MKTRSKKRIAIIGTVGLPANYGGFETLAEHLTENLSENYDMTVYCSAKKYAKNERKKEHKGARLVYLPFDANGIQSIFYDSFSILHALFFADVLLILGVAGAWLLPFVRLLTNKKIIISIDGIEWKRDKWSLAAKLYLFWAESLAVKYSHIDISDNEAIQDYTAARYKSLSRIIEYGADHSAKVQMTEAAKTQYPFLHGRYAFKVCRIEPENNVHLILEAFENVIGLPLVMVGNWNNSEYGQTLKEHYAKCPNITLLDPIYDQNRLDMLRSNAAVYVHGHSAGGTNPSLVEAMYLGLPVVAYAVSYNRVTTENKAFYFKDKDSLIEILTQTSEQAFEENAEKMKKIADLRYRWKYIAKRYELLVEEALVTQKKGQAHTHISELDYKHLLEMNISHLKTSQEVTKNW